MGMPKIHEDSLINTIRGRNLVGAASKEDVEKLFEHIDAMEVMLDETDLDDYFGTDGWRHRVGVA